MCRSGVTSLELLSKNAASTQLVMKEHWNVHGIDAVMFNRFIYLLILMNNT